MHGSQGSMWYAQFIAHILFSNESLYMNKFMAVNTRHSPHQNYSLNSYNEISKVILFFENKIKKNINLNKIFYPLLLQR